MSDETNTAGRFIQLKIFGGDMNDDNSREDLEKEIEHRDQQRQPDPSGGFLMPSIYVAVFEEMACTICGNKDDESKSEIHLLSDGERATLYAFSTLSYNARYCLVRLILRKPGKCYPLSALKDWEKEVGKDAVLPSLLPLCRTVAEILAESAPLDNVIPPSRTHETIDLTESDEDVKPNIQELDAKPVAGPSRPVVTDDPIERINTLIAQGSSVDDELDLSRFCVSDEDMSLQELLETMKVDDLKELAKMNKCSPPRKGPKKVDYISAILSNARSQKDVSSYFVKSPTKGKGKVSEVQRQTCLPFKPLGLPQCPNQERRLRAQILKILGRCFRANHDFYRLARRFHIIALRATEHPSQLMLPALLTKFKKRTYAPYTYGRDTNIWRTRREFLEYERALELEMNLDKLIDAKPDDQHQRGGTATPSRWKTPARVGTPRTNSAAATPAKEEAEDYAYEPEETEVTDDPKIMKAKRIVQYLDQWILGQWKIQVELKKEMNASRTPALQRFEPGYIYSRMLRKAIKSLATLKEYEKELEIIECMLGQRLFMRGKRGKLYERRAVLQIVHLSNAATGSNKTDILNKARMGLKQALCDEDTHLVLRPSLLRRLQKLEKKLQTPPEDRTVCEGQLREADVVLLSAQRVYHRASSLRLDASGTPVNKGNIAAYMTPTGKGGASSTATKLQEDAKPLAVQRKRRGKTIWVGLDDEEVDVEHRALQDYEKRGFKGFHAETSILTTIFGLLFWDVIFTEVRGAFETEYQVAPLDIVDESSFYYARKDLMDARLDELRDGKGVEILSRHWEHHSRTKTWCIGVRWDICELQDLVEILESLGGRKLASVCQLFCEDYTGRCSGAPDLIAWNAEHRICKFIEVKGPGDTPQENQKLWFDSLLAAGIDVEICQVDEPHAIAKIKHKQAAATSKKRGRKGKKGLESDEDEQDYEKLDCEFDDELPQIHLQPPRKRRRVAEPALLERS